MYKTFITALEKVKNESILKPMYELYLAKLLNDKDSTYFVILVFLSKR
jgi:hypothetical protein